MLWTLPEPVLELSQEVYCVLNNCILFEVNFLLTYVNTFHYLHNINKLFMVKISKDSLMYITVKQYCILFNSLIFGVRVK